MRFYGGNTKRIIKKTMRSVFYFDGGRYPWVSGLRMLEILCKLQPGHVCYIPYLGLPSLPETWGIVERVVVTKRSLYRRRGWVVDDVIIHVRAKNDQVYYVYDAEHWFYRVTNEFTEQFNRQIGLPLDFHFRAGQIDLLSA